MRFIPVDLETANRRMSSVCQIGVVTFEDGKPELNHPISS